MRLLRQITPVLLCGGSGTRLWPLSRRSYPKQFSQLLGVDSCVRQIDCFAQFGFPIGYDLRMQDRWMFGGLGYRHVESGNRFAMLFRGTQGATQLHQGERIN